MDRNKTGAIGVPLAVIEDGKLNLTGLPSAVCEIIQTLLDENQNYDFEIEFIKKEE